MKIRLLAIGTRMPEWVATAFKEYQKRLPSQCALELVEIRAAQRGARPDPKRAVKAESESLLAAIKDQERIIALDQRGQQWTSDALANQLADWLQEGRNVAMLIGGADGLAQAVRARAHQVWSLSALTLPHAVVRVVVAEQLYRAWSMLQGSPYHRHD